MRSSRNWLAVVAVIGMLMSMPIHSARAAIFNDLATLEQADDFALDPMFDSTGWFTVQNQDGSFFGGSGVLIDPYWVLTAGHVLLEEGTSQWDAFAFSTAPSAYDAVDSLIAADAAFVFDGYNQDMQPGSGSDIGLVRLSEPILDVDPAVRFRGTDQEGTHFYSAGYGRPGIWPNEGDFDGIKRAGENIADTFGGLGGIVQEQYWVSNFNFSGDALPLEWQGSSLDSGGGWYSDIGGQMHLIGISNFVRGQNTMTGGLRLSLYNDWIDETMASNQVPEPATWVMFASGMLGALAARRRRRLNV